MWLLLSMQRKSVKVGTFRDTLLAWRFLRCAACGSHKVEWLVLAKLFCLCFCRKYFATRLLNVILDMLSSTGCTDTLVRSVDKKRSQAKRYLLCSVHKYCTSHRQNCSRIVLFLSASQLLPSILKCRLINFPPLPTS